MTIKAVRLWSRQINAFVDDTLVKNFNELVGGVNVSSNGTQLGEHLLYFNPMWKPLSQDGYFQCITPSELLQDHTLRYKRRVWAGGTLQQNGPLRYMTQYNCEEVISSIKTLKSGTFVTMKRQIRDTQSSVTVIKELRTLLYTNKSPQVITYPVGQEIFSPFAKFTFHEMDVIQYSQLTLNPHRIHWDKLYCQNVEKYKDIVVQGPFILQIMLRSIKEHSFLGAVDIATIKYRNVNFVYPETELQICVDSTKKTFYMRDVLDTSKIYAILQILN
ncbi:hydroxyacyl-thioester dehydratase HTD2 KNAG_0B04680 [Huiozyma naganishii CBS 8797]|uniref:MaoC-like domain-containing protein n=1 Tax=Huiozyma naganishii (strain ATCC MYA-139 / BCRC 22969 / CBS 8797 / KCTC 17520 / NBRC 10181 / NCYC 3082 / Yp74L-3) TaxID=1071383 RepID=J7RH89_HUIN7|nr:hypothetical protein KNAG_0B04680 [Kazachstania naganishii CBS 8797]CCK68903.1 hypothetical protein KNAG_0B04680 [Kazachstania naganishii CBS 8797]